MRQAANAGTSLAAFFLLLVISTPVCAVSARGYVRSQCPMTGPSHLHITQIDGRKLSRELNLQIPEQKLWGVLGDEWYDYPGEGCSSGECEAPIRSKVQILHVSLSPLIPFRSRRTSHISGNFEIELRGGKVLTGSFEAKFLNPPKGLLCE